MSYFVLGIIGLLFAIVFLMIFSISDSIEERIEELEISVLHLQLKNNKAKGEDEKE